MKEKLALVIAALMITSMALSISTTSVSAAESTATISPETVKANTRVLLTIRITNQTSENIENILIRAPAGSFTEAIGGLYTIENLKLAADNLENAAKSLKLAGENMKLAEDIKRTSADNFESAGLDLNTAGTYIGEGKINETTGGTANYDIVNSAFLTAGGLLVGLDDKLEVATENFVDARNSLNDIGVNIYNAGVEFKKENALDTANDGDTRVLAGENLKLAGTAIQNAGDNLQAGSLRQAGTLLQTAASRIYDAAINLAFPLEGNENLQKAANKLDNNVRRRLNDAGQGLIDAAQKDNLAGINLKSVADHLESVASYLKAADSDLQTAGNALDNTPTDNNAAADRIRNAGDNLTNATDNVLQAGLQLSYAAENLSVAATALGAVLGGTELTNATTDENTAAANLKDREKVNLTAAGTALVDAASDLSAAASKMLSTANAMKPARWTLDEGPGTWGKENLLFSALNENYRIAPGASENFVFVWKSPTDGTYTLKIWGYKPGAGLGTPTFGPLEVTITVDGTVPKVTKIEVTQAGVAVKNLVGNTYDGGKATVTITFSEKLSAIGDVLVKDVDNFLPPLTVSTTDNITYTATIDNVGKWDDNVTTIVVKKATDLVGNENSSLDNQRFWVDTRAPVFLDNGLTTLVGQMIGLKVQAGTNLVFRVDNNADQTISGRIEDNWTAGARLTYDNSHPTVISVKLDIDGTVITIPRTVPPTPDNSFSKSFTLLEGKTSALKVVLTDWTGNSTEAKLENIFIDTKAPTIAFNTIAGKTWPAEGALINDSKPRIKITVLDPTPGLGVAYKVGSGLNENFLYVALDNDDNIRNPFPAAPYGRLENAIPWVVADGVFENVCDNAGKGLVDGTYYITVMASDNLGHAGWDNVIAGRKFTIDTMAPAAPSIDTAYQIVSTMDNPVVVKTTSRTIGGTAEAGTTIKVYGTVDTTETTFTTTAGSDGKWTVTFTLTAGSKTKIEVSATDAAGNEGSRTLYGWMLADDRAPTVTLATLPKTTDKPSISISGTVTKDAWEDWSDITLTVQVGTGRVEVPIGAGGSYTYSLELAEGPNTIVVQAIDDIGNASPAATATVERVVTPWAIYAIILVIVALVLAAIAIFREPIFRRKK